MESILIVDDDQVYLDVLKLNLESFGYRTIAAGSANEAWLKLDGEAVDLVILDAAMPIEDGYSFARRMRADRRLSAIPLVFLSGFGGTGERANAFEAGADEFIEKPCSADDLVARVRSHLKRRAWQRRIDEGLARIQDVERARDELLAVVLHEVGGLVAVVEAELRQAVDSGHVSGEGLECVRRAVDYARDLDRIVASVRARHGWRQLSALTPAPAVADGA